MIIDNMKPANGPRVCYFNAAAPLCVGDTILVVIMQLQLFSIARSSFEGMFCSIFCLCGLALLAR